jgi:peptidoglycan hydrolase-like protein with peptidoglycan-binding domain
MEAILPMVLKILLQTAGPEVEKLLREKLFPQVPEANVGDALASSLDANGTKWVQAALNMIDRAKLDVNGKYGPATRAAVEKFQRSHGLTVDGWAAVNTNDALRAALLNAKLKARFTEIAAHYRDLALQIDDPVRWRASLVKSARGASTRK